MATNPWFSKPAPVNPGPGDPGTSEPADTVRSPFVPAAAARSAAAVGTAALVAFARARLADGRSPEQAFTDLAAIVADRRLAAIAVCTAAGTPWAVAEARMTALGDIWTSISGGSAETAGGLLELYGYFDVEVELPPDRQVIASYLRQALAAVEYLPTGYANQMDRLLRTGRLREALLSLEDMGARRWPDNLPFWLGMAQAAARLDSEEILDTELAAVRRRCEARTGR